MSLTESYISINGCRIRMLRGGKGPSVLYLHGANGVPRVQPFMTRLASSFDVLVPEHPGFGYSDEPEWLANMQDLAFFYLDFLNHQKLDTVHVVGSSLGGWLAMEMAIREPSRFGSVVLVGAAGVRAPHTKPGDIFLWNPETLARNTFYSQAIADQVLALPPGTPEEQEAQLKSRHTLAKLAWEPRLFNPHLAKWLHRLNMPVKLVWGQDDKIIPLATGQRLRELMPHSTLEVFEQCGHLPQVEHETRFSESVARFINEGK